ncbi:MAG: hypothetical protein ABIM31_06830 [candidate division WOR-3 bacterium]
MGVLLFGFECNELYTNIEIIRYLLNQRLKFPIAEEDREPFLITLILIWKFIEYLLSPQPPQREFLEDLTLSFKLYNEILNNENTQDNEKLATKRDTTLRDSKFASIYGIVKKNKVELSLPNMIIEYKSFLEKERKRMEIKPPTDGTSYHKNELFSLIEQLEKPNILFKKDFELSRRLSASLENLEFLKLKDSDIIDFFKLMLDAFHKSKKKPSTILEPSAFRVFKEHLKYLINLGEVDYTLAFETLGEVIERKSVTNPIQKLTEEGDWGYIIKSIPQEPFYVTYSTADVPEGIITQVNLELSKTETMEAEISKELEGARDLWRSSKFRTYWFLCTFSLHNSYENPKFKVNMP